MCHQANMNAKNTYSRLESTSNSHKLKAKNLKAKIS